VRSEAGAADLQAVKGGEVEVILTDPGRGGLPVVFAGPDLLALHPQWEVDGDWKGSGALLGRQLRERKLAAAPESTTGRTAFPVAGSVTTGGPLDASVFLPLGSRVVGSGTSPGVDRIEVRTALDQLDEVVRGIEERVPACEARPLRAVREADVLLLRRLGLLFDGTALVTLLLAVVTAGGVASALVEARRRELALFLALGGTGRRLRLLLLAELSSVGVLAVAAGLFLGETAATLVAERVLGAGASWRIDPAAAAAGGLAVMVVVGVAAGASGRGVAGTRPAEVLRGR
jgi:hypothetical protein